MIIPLLERKPRRKVEAKKKRSNSGDYETRLKAKKRKRLMVPWGRLSYKKDGLLVVPFSG